MKLVLATDGVTEDDVVQLVSVATGIAAAWYRRHPDARPLTEMRVRYQPDVPSDLLTIVLPGALRPGDRVSCGTASIAVAGWMRAQGMDARVVLSRIHADDAFDAEVPQALWHATVSHRRDGHVRVWDPAEHLEAAHG